MNKESFLKKIDRIDDLPTLPAIAMEVNRMLQDYNTSIKMLSDRIEKDQAMVAKILKLVNSAFFGVQSKIGSVSHAVILLGFNTIRNAIISVSIIDSMPMNGVSDDLDITDFWKHSVAVAVTSKFIAEKTQLHTTDDCFIGGLLHDIGKVVLAQHFQDIFIKIWTKVQNDCLSFFDAEKNEVPVNHAHIGGLLAKKWQLPTGLVDSIRYHHIVNKNTHNPNIVMIVHVADIIVNTYWADSKGKLDRSLIHPEAIKTMMSLLDTIPDWFPDVSIEIESACNFFIEELKK